jgi:hypothetical protein
VKKRNKDVENRHHNFPADFLILISGIEPEKVDFAEIILFT